MTTETKPIIDLSEWEEIRQMEYHDYCGEIGRTLVITVTGGIPRYFKRKPKPVKSLEERVRDQLWKPCASLNETVKLVDLIYLARIIEKHYRYLESIHSDPSFKHVAGNR